MPPSSNSAAALAKYIHNYSIRTLNLHPGGKPGFPHGLKLFYNTIDLDRLSFPDDNSMTYRYPLSKDIPKFTTGVMMALMDELSTMTCFRVGLPGPPGWSLQMQTEMVQPPSVIDQCSELDIVNRVSKFGRNVSYTRTEFLCPSTQEVMAYSSHVKYMPTMDAKLDEALVSQEKYEQYVVDQHGDVVPDHFDEKPLLEGVILPYLEFDANEPGRGRFQVSLEHTNPFAAMHGGCHALIMEQVAERFAKAQLNSDNVVHEAMQVDYMNGAKGDVDIVCERIGHVENLEKGESSIHVRVHILSGDKICSEGKLRFSTSG